MVNSIRGILTFKAPGLAGMETGGVEWALEVSATSLSRLPALGAEVRLYTHLHHVQDSMRLYGFADIDERRLFLALLSVSGVGPALARKILSGTTPERFIAALETEDIESLGAIPGLGKKTAQKIVLQLRGECLPVAHRRRARRRIFPRGRAGGDRRPGVHGIRFPGRRQSRERRPRRYRRRRSHR